MTNLYKIHNELKHISWPDLPDVVRITTPFGDEPNWNVELIRSCSSDDDAIIWFEGEDLENCLSKMLSYIKDSDEYKDYERC